MFPLNIILAWNINIIMNKKYDNNNIIIASRAYFLHSSHGDGLMEGLDDVQRWVWLEIVLLGHQRFTQVQGPPLQR
jgi:hypothetical protein